MADHAELGQPGPERLVLEMRVSVRGRNHHPRSPGASERVIAAVGRGAEQRRIGRHVPELRMLVDAEKCSRQGILPRAVEDEHTRLPGEAQPPGLERADRLAHRSRPASARRLERHHPRDREQVASVRGELEVLEPPGEQQNRERLPGLGHSVDPAEDPSTGAAAGAGAGAEALASADAGESAPALSGLISERVAPAISAADTFCGW